MAELAADWDGLAREFDLWAAADLRPTLWWRDDDAVAASPALRELQQMAQVPVALAVIPALNARPPEQSLAEAVAGWPLARVLQHGFSHRNNAAPGAKKSEFPKDRPGAEIGRDLAAGRAILGEIFGSRFVPVLTPPWNRLAADWVGQLPELGYRGLTRFGEPPYVMSPPGTGLTEINTQVDVIDWRGSRGFAGESACLGRLVGHLAARRSGGTAQDLPTGLLTHHLVHDTATWRFLEKLQDWLARRRQLSLFQSAADLWSPGFPA